MVVKLHFDLAPAQLPRLRRTDVIRRYSQGPSTTTRQRIVHFDTSALDLHRRGVALVLRSQNSVWTQEIRHTDYDAEDTSEPPRHEWQVPESVLDLSLLRRTSFAGLLKKKHVRRSLVPIFSMRFSHTVLPLSLGDDCKATLHTDIGETTAGSRKQQVCKARLELESGDPTRLFAVALDLLRSIPMRLSNRTMEERGYLLVLGTAEKPRKADRTDLPRHMTRVEAERLIAASCLAQIQSNEAGFLDHPDPEYLHQLRIGWRRLRSAASMPDSALWNELPKLLVLELRWIWGLLGTARDWDVFVDEFLPAMIRAAATSGHRANAFTMFQAHCDRMRKLHVEAARGAIRSPRYQRLLLNMAWIVMDSHAAADPQDELAPSYTVQEFAREALIRHGRKLRKRMHPQSLASMAQRHRARIAAKRLRYACDFFHNLFPGKPTRRYLARLETMLDALGHLNDLANCSTLIDQTSTSKERLLGPAAMDLVHRWLRAEESKTLSRLEKARRSFAEHTVFWAPDGRTVPDQPFSNGQRLRDRREDETRIRNRPNT